MTTEQRITIIMRCYNRGLKPKLIAECMGLTEKYVTNIINREVKNAKKDNISN